MLSIQEVKQSVHTLSWEAQMFWELCVLYANGTEEVLKVFQDLEIAQNCVDRIYAQDGYPMHMAYKVRPTGVA